MHGIQESKKVLTKGIYLTPYPGFVQGQIQIIVSLGIQYPYTVRFRVHSLSASVTALLFGDSNYNSNRMPSLWKIKALVLSRFEKPVI